MMHKTMVSQGKNVATIPNRRSCVEGKTSGLVWLPDQPKPSFAVTNTPQATRSSWPEEQSRRSN
jgi:hypothetical protein